MWAFNFHILRQHIRYTSSYFKNHSYLNISAGSLTLTFFFMSIGHLDTLGMVHDSICRGDIWNNGTKEIRPIYWHSLPKQLFKKPCINLVISIEKDHA